MSKKILMIAGPNGAGKTTISLELINDQGLFYEFLNADEIAKGLAPLHPETVAITASKLLITRLKQLLETKVKSKMLCKFNPLAFYLLFTNF